MATVLKCQHCLKTFEIDLEVEKINTSLLQTCPKCLGKIQRGEPLPDEQRPAEKAPATETWF
jgi:DNA-directed RNA polymerase subunit RPC12/RpoP